jgi:iron(III) transport system ATP-binding protein
MSFLDISGLSKTYGSVKALDGIDLHVRSGTRTAIVGPSGCGKTTLLRLIAGFETPDSGRILLDGQTLAENRTALPAHMRGVGVVSQDGALFPHLTIAENIGFGIPKSESNRATRIAELAETVGLKSAMLSRWPHELSGGQQQRVALARALARKPRLMLLDEPFSALDTSLRAAMRKVVAELLEKAGVTTILVTHDQAEALSFADQVAVMRDGRFAQVGTPRDLYFRPTDATVAEFLGETILLPAYVADGCANCALGRLATHAPVNGAHARIMLRPEQIALEPATRAEAQAASSGIYAEVCACEFAGASTVLVLNILNPSEANGAVPPRFTLRRAGFDGIETGAVVRVSVWGRAHPLA